MRVSLNEIGPFRHVIGQVHHELINPAPEVAAQLVDNAGLVESTLSHQNLLQTQCVINTKPATVAGFFVPTRARLPKHPRCRGCAHRDRVPIRGVAVDHRGALGVRRLVSAPRRAV